MLSILIPIYNFDVQKLVEGLCKQGHKADVVFEIICLDDGSEMNYKIANRSLEKLQEVYYEELSHNAGRSRIRNLLAERARYDYLLLMDCDSGIPDKHYIKNYLDQMGKDKLLYGGRVYHATPPDNPELLLHWTYGISREQQSPATRATAPYHSFMTNNFLIPKKILLEIRFDESLKGYGHEDTLFGFELKKRGVVIQHINNPLYHLGLESADVFLRKTQEGIRNLLYLEQNEEVALETRLLRVYRFVQKSYLASFLLSILALAKSQLLKNLHSRHPNMRVFDLIKLYWLIKESKNK